MEVKPKGKEEALGIIKVKNGYMVTKGGDKFYNTGYTELNVFNAFDGVIKHLAENFNEKKR